MSAQFFESRMGRQYYEVTLPELVRQLHRLNDLLALGVEQMEQNAETKGDGGNPDGALQPSSRD
ncbi:MAG: hypothetical protein IPK20_00070 [Betaproteobacteria bacterium]|nr:hypothetical protein [Betaproteobacteria bacterium]